jgi:hypothetical protein
MGVVLRASWVGVWQLTLYGVGSVVSSQRRPFDLGGLTSRGAGCLGPPVEWAEQVREPGEAIEP